MILNMSDDTGLVLLTLVNAASERMLKRIPKLKGDKRSDAIAYIQHLGIVKHRLEVNLWVGTFAGPGEWGFPRNGKPPAKFIGEIPKII